MHLHSIGRWSRLALALGLATGLSLATAWTLRAQTPAGRLEAIDLPLPAIPWLVLPVRWEGRSALMVYTRGEAAVPGSPGGARLSVFGVRPAGWILLAEWPLPPGTRWVEPLRLAGGETAWLALTGPEVHIGRVTAAGLAWQSLCACPSLYSQTDPEELGSRLARDLDGDGADEVLLPTARGMAIYRPLRIAPAAAAPIALEPLALDLWDTEGRSLAVGPDGRSSAVPELMPWTTRNATRLVRLDREALVAYSLSPQESKASRIVLDSAARIRVQNAGLPAPVRAWLARVPDGGYKDGAALAAALGHAGADDSLAPQFSALLTSLKGKWDEGLPERTALPGLTLRRGDRAVLLALEDFTGDGVPDLVHGLLRNESQILKAESELRLYVGTSVLPLTFAAPQTIRAQGPAVASVLDVGAKERMLLVARTEATLNALFRALSSRQLSVEASAYTLGSSGLSAQPVRRAILTFQGFEEGAQVLVLTADLAGTGRAALLMNLQPDAINVYFPDAAGPDFDKPEERFQGPLPRKREETLIGDWLGEGRESILFWYRGRKFSADQRRTLRLVRWVPKG